MAEPFTHDPVIADAAVSPLAGIRQPGTFGRDTMAPGVTLSERFGLAIADIASWPGTATRTRNAISRVTGLDIKAAAPSAWADDCQAFEYAPARWTVVSNDGAMPQALAKSAGVNATVTDLSHGRTIIRVEGDSAEWVLAKLFAIDFDENSFPIGKGIATSHHAISAQIQRTGDDIFDVIVFRSYARSFWHALTTASEEVGYSVE